MRFERDIPSTATLIAPLARVPVVHPGNRHEGGTPRRLAWLVLLPLVFAFSLTCLFSGMRGVLDLGGMVAAGGPYEIARPAPSWWWIFPLFIFACILSMLLVVMKPSIGKNGSLIVALAWPALFISLGWNFLEYGFFKGDGLMWGWIICGIVFVPMGALPLFGNLLAVRTGGGSR